MRSDDLSRLRVVADIADRGCLASPEQIATFQSSRLLSSKIFANQCAVVAKGSVGSPVATLSILLLGFSISHVSIAMRVHSLRMLRVAVHVFDICAIGTAEKVAKHTVTPGLVVGFDQRVIKVVARQFRSIHVGRGDRQHQKKIQDLNFHCLY